jgi:aspartate aminotransferase-like enzyme
LDFTVVQQPWGKAFDTANLRQRIQSATPTWLWCTHCETSAGILNELEALKGLCAESGVKLCLDGISSIGTTPVDLRGVHLASCTSGKGLRSFPGLGMVFYNHEIKESPDRVPRYLDLGLYAKNQGVAFTHSSNLVHALHAAIRKIDWPERFLELAETSAWLRTRLREIGFEILGADTEASPAVMTILLQGLNSVKVGGQLQEAGFLLSYNSEYLRGRNLIQICLMGEFSREKLVALLNHLNRICFRRTQAQSSAGVLPSRPATGG